MNERNLAAVPVGACRFDVGVVEFGDNGENAKSARIRLKARSGASIDHWYWGKVVHDLAGMRVHKPRLPVDYAHDSAEVLGYVNHFDTESGDLILSGALTPWREDDRASEVIYKMREGVPYEASIFFGGDGIKVQEVEEGQTEQVNGRAFDGPGVVIREWPLRGVAICPYGADANTESATFDSGGTVAARKWEQPEQELAEMKEDQAVEAEVETEDADASVDVPAVEAEAGPTVEALTAQLSEASKNADALTAEVKSLTAERDALTGEIADLRTERDKAGEAMAAMSAERDELEAKLAQAEADNTALTAERDEANRKLAAIEAGESPVSREPAEGNENTGSLMERARKGNRK